MRRLKWFSLLGLLFWSWSVPALAQQGQFINGHLVVAGMINAGTSTGSGNAYLLTLAPPITDYVINQCFSFRANHTNTGAATLNINNRGAKALQKYVGVTLTDLVADDIVSGKIVLACYDGAAMQAYSLSTGTGGGGGGAPTGASYLTRTAEAGLSNESNLGTFPTGSLIKCIVSGGICTPTAAVVGADFPDPAVAVSAVSAYAETDRLVLAAGATRGTKSGTLKESDLATKSGTETFTGKTLNAEDAGNNLGTVSKLWLPAAGCDNTTAFLFWDTGPTNAPVPACITGSNTVKGVAEFADNANLSMQTRFPLPPDWVGAIDARLKWLSVGTTGNVMLQLATACASDGDSDDPVFNTASTVIDATKATTMQNNDATIAGVTTTGCVAGDLLHLRLSRDALPAQLNDTLPATARVIGVEITLRRLQ